MMFVKDKELVDGDLQERRSTECKATDALGSRRYKSKAGDNETLHLSWLQRNARQI